MSLTFADITAAHERIRPYIVRTPVLTNAGIDPQHGRRLFFKCENLQAAGAFKTRGACNAVFALGDEVAARGVATHSSGNHAAALSRAAQLRGIPAHIVMPINAPRTKVHNVGSFGGWISFCDANLAAREAACAKIIAEKGATLVHPFDDYLVMAGQGTATIELLEDEPDLDAILVPVGGGGLLCGTAVAAKALKPGLKVYGVEPALADDVAQSLRAGKRIAIPSPATIADGLRTNCTGEKNFPLIQEHVAGILTVSEDSIRAAMKRLHDVMHLEVEPSAAVPLAAVLEGRLPPGHRRIGLILTGGNVDRETLAPSR
jgi:threonine dehydratase